jgi:DNA-binding MarR family transcriptional regulator
MRRPQSLLALLEDRHARSQASIAWFHSLMQLHARLARLRSGASAKFALSHARLRVLGVVARTRDLCISDIARELDLTRQAVHRVVHDLVELKMLELAPSRRSARERIPRLIAGGRVAAGCGLGWERRWFEQLGRGIETTTLQWMHHQAERHRRQLPWRVDDPEELELPDEPPPLRPIQLAPGTLTGWRTRI